MPKIIYNDKEVMKAFRNGPPAMRRHLKKNLLRGGLEISREGQRNLRRNRSLAFSTLINSFQVRPVTDFEVHVTVGAAHGIYVEEGSGPGGQPNKQTLLDWIKVKRLQPYDPSMDADDLEFLISRKIRTQGIEKKPFVGPAVESKRSRVFQLIEKGVDDGLREAGLSR